MKRSPQTRRWEELHEELMRRALRLAKRGLERVSPNPMVGALLVRDGRIIAEGWHRRFGGPHAEVEALRRARDPRGADLYVTLEPCGHHGKTPPCAEAIVRAGIRRVFYGVRDPNPATAGKGPRLLRSHGIPAIEGCLRDECARLNAPFFRWVTTGRPWVILKWAMTLDGKTATAAGESRWITGDEARAHAHRLRRRVDAIVVGTATALEDDPSLLPRPSGGRHPLRVILDARGRLPLGLRLLSKSDRPGEDRRIYVTSRQTPAGRLRLLESRGLSTVRVRLRGGLLDLDAILGELGARGVSQLLVEGGGHLSGSFLAQGLVDEVAAFVAPRLLGGRDSRGALEGPGMRLLSETPWLEAPTVLRVGKDFLIAGRLAGSPQEGR